MLRKTKSYPANSYAAWLTAAAAAHRSGDPELKARADRLHMEHKVAAKRERSRIARMTRNN